jgi:hypothetical protein
MNEENKDVNALIEGIKHLIVKSINEESSIPSAVKTVAKA